MKDAKQGLDQKKQGENEECMGTKSRPGKWEGSEKEQVPPLWEVRVSRVVRQVSVLGA